MNNNYEGTCGKPAFALEVDGAGEEEGDEDGEDDEDEAVDLFFNSGIFSELCIEESRECLVFTI